MKDKAKTIIIIILLCILVSHSTNAENSLESTGRIIINNPTTGEEEIIFDYADQNRLKDSININTDKILSLEEFKNQQIEKNEKFKEDIEGLDNSLGGLEFTVIDGQPQWKERGADTFNPFKGNSISSKYIMKDGIVNTDIFSDSYNKSNMYVNFYDGYLELKAGGDANGEFTFTSPISSGDYDTFVRVRYSVHNGNTNYNKVYLRGDSSASNATFDIMAFPTVSQGETIHDYVVAALPNTDNYFAAHTYNTRIIRIYDIEVIKFDLEVADENFDDTYIFYNGRINADLTGGLVTTAFDPKSISIIKPASSYGDGFIKLTAGFKSGYYQGQGNVYTANKIDLSDKNVLKVNVLSTDDYCDIFYAPDNKPVAQVGNQRSIPENGISLGTLVEGENTFDISSIDSAWIGICQISSDVDQRTVVIDKIWFE